MENKKVTGRTSGHSGFFSVRQPLFLALMRERNKWVLLLLVLLCSQARALGQFSDSVHYYVKLASTGSINRTSDKSAYLLTHSAAFRMSREALKLNLTGSYLYGKQNDLLSNNDVHAAVDFNFYHTPRLYSWGLGSFSKSYSLKVVSQYQAGLGMAYSVFENQFGFLNLSDGFLYESSDLYRADSTRQLYHTVRNSFRLMYKLSYKDFVNLEGTHFLQNSLQYGDDYIFRSINSLSVKLTSWLRLTSSLIFNRVSRTNSENLLISYGLVVEHYF